MEAIGGAVTAALAGVAVEGGSGGRHGASGTRCRNCGTVLAGSHCHGCGQSAHIHRSFGAIGHDLLHSIFHVEGKIWNTLPLLAWRPGDLTRRFIHGERASFLSPLALFLFAVFLTYAVIAMVGGGAGTNQYFDANAAAKAQTEVNGIREGMKSQLAEIDTRIAEADKAGTSTDELREQRSDLMKAAKVMGLVETTGGETKVSDTAQRNFSFVDLDTGNATLDRLIKKANDNPSLLLYKLQANAYKFAWALIPLSLPFMWLLFPFSRRYHVYDHFVFVTYSLSFMLLLFVVVRMGSLIPGAADSILALALCYVPFHMYRQLRGAYRGGRVVTVLRTLLLTQFALLAVVAFLLLLLAMGIMG